MFRLQVLVMGSVVAVGVLAMFGSAASDHDDHEHEHDEFLFYDFWSGKPASDVKDHFKGTTIIKSLKAYGVGRYLFLVKNDHSKALKSFNLPNDAEKIRVFTIETLHSFFSHFSIQWPSPSLEHQDDKDLTFLERTWHPRGMTQEQFIEALHNQAGRVSPTSKEQVFTPTAGLPVKMFFFLTRSQYSIAELFLKHTSALGGPGNLDIHTTRIFNI